MTPPDRAPDRAPLSYAQEGIWLTQLLHPDNPRFTATAWFGLAADVTAEQVTAALRAVAARHESLRTTFSTAWEQPGQLVHPVDRVDVRVRESTEAELADALTRAFDVSTAPPWQAHLTRLAGGGQTLTLLAHHLVTDDRSMDLWIRELTALLDGTPADRLPALEVQYADFARWQRGWIAEPEQKPLVEHWQEVLAGIPASSGLPPDRSPAPGGPLSAARTVSVPPAVATRIRAHGRRAGATGLTAWSTLLAEVLGARSGQDRVPIGCVTEGRHLAEVAPLIGCFSSIVVFATDVGGRPDFDTALQRTRRTVLEALRHGEMPFSVLVEKVNPLREPGTVPLAQVGIQMTERRNSGPVGAGPAARDEQVVGRGPATSSSPFDLELAIEELADGGVRITALHRADLYRESTVDDLLTELSAAAARAAEHPDQPLRPAASPAAAAPPAAALDVPDRRLDQLVADRGVRTPGAVAISCDDQQLTYAQLDRRAAAVHCSMDRAGVRPGDRVGVLMDRSIDLLPAILGSWRAGAVYVPLDPGYPPARLAHMVRAGGTAVVVCDRELTDVATGLGATPLVVDRLAQTDLEPVPGGAGDAAYVMFTSGSTGVPKGVVVEHGSAVATLLAVADEVGVTADDVLLAVTPTSFDISVLELLLPLLLGGTVVVASRAATRDGEALLALARRSGASVLQATPATWRMLAAADPGRRLDVAVLCGGEALAPDLAAELRGRGRGQWNLYGPTEATIWASSWRLHEAGDERVSIGRALASATLHVLDGDLAPVPTGTAGELLIGGPCVARGYLDDPDATAARFVPVGPGGERLYRTGDMVRERPDGMLDFLGRLDSQVKVRGHRIELTEVEATLRLHPAVADAVAVAKRDGSGEHQLVAYLLPAGGPPDRGELATFLATRVPGYLVPTTFFVVDAVPLTPNGKVDRLALAAIDPPRLGAADPTTAAASPVRSGQSTTDTERQVAAICAELIGTAGVGPDDDFFALGGHSLLMVQLLSRLRSTFSAPVPLRALFDQPTVRAIAAAVDRHRPDGGSTSDTPAAPKLVRRSRD